MVVTAVKNFTITRGDTPTKQFNISLSGGSYDMTGSTVVLTIKKDINQTDILYQITGTAGVGTVSFDFGTEQTGTVTKFAYDIQETTSGGKTNTLVLGNISITPDVNN